MAIKITARNRGRVAGSRAAAYGMAQIEIGVELHQRIKELSEQTCVPMKQLARELLTAALAQIEIVEQ